MNKPLKRLFQDHQGKISDKWSLYLDEWDRLFKPYRDQKVNLLEIGVQNGGSLEVWSRYFLKAVKIVGCDIDKNCGHLRYDDARIAVIVGDANADDCESEILQQALIFDIILDDGSHKTSDILRSFARYFPHLSDGGTYVVEDLHCSYWDNFEGGLHNPLSAMAFFKRLTDVLNHEHWRNNQSTGSFLTKFAEEFGIKFNEFDLTRIHSIEFVNSLCTIRKLPPDKNVLGERIIVGTDEDITTGSNTVNRTMIQEMPMDIKDDGNLDVFELMAHNQNLDTQVAENEQQLQSLSAQVNKQMAENEQQVQSLTAQVNRLMAENEQQVKSLTAQVNLLETTSNALRGGKEEAEQELQSTNFTLDEIYRSRGWRIIKLLRQLRGWLVPHGSAREDSLRYVYRPVRYWRAYGFRALLKRVFKKRSALPDTAKTSPYPAVTPLADKAPISELRRTIEGNDHLDPYLGSLPVFLTPFSKRRLNIVINDIDSNQPFGQVAVAIIFSSLFSEKWDYDLRIVTGKEPINKQYFRDILESNNITWNRNIEFLTINPNISRTELPVGQGDLFLATSWRTTENILNVLGDNKIICLLAENERENLLQNNEHNHSLEILQNPRIKFIVNTQVLYEQLVSDGFENMRVNGVWFEPAWPENLFFPDRTRPDSRKNFFYTVSGNAESLIDLGFEAMEEAIHKGIFDLNEWDFFLVGKGSQKIKSSHSFLLKHYQDLSWEDYLSLIRKTDLGLSLTGAAFLLPDYNPFDLIASGAVVVTDFLENRPGLGALSKNLLCCTAKVDEITKGLADGAALIQNTGLRLQNFRENGLLKDWRVSFQEALVSMERWGFNVPA